LLLAVLVSTKLRAGGSRHAFGPRQLPSKPCRPHRDDYSIPNGTAA